MEFTTFLTIFSNTWFLFPLVIFAVIIKSAWFKGVLGEWQVNLLIRLFLDKNEYHLIKDVTLPTADGTTQIDHILVSKYGVFVIETKNVKGWIFGSEHHKQWTQKLYKHSSKFQNPLHQNYKHIKTLETSLGIDHSNIFSVIIFIGDSTFKTNMPENVTFARGGIEYIRSHITTVFTDNEVAKLIDQIESDRLERGIKTNRQHVQYLHSNKEDKAEHQKMQC